MSPELRVLQVLLIPLGLAAIAIGCMIFFMGAEWTLFFFERNYALLTGQVPLLKPAWISTTIDSELRFYSVFWIAFGVITTRAGLSLPKDIRLVPILLTLFFIGGLGRVLSVINEGVPHDLMIFLMAVELIIPIIGLPLVYIYIKDDEGDLEW